MEIKRKSLAYITVNEELLVFRQPDFPEAGIQVPKGTIEDGDTPEETIIREIEEETGIIYREKPIFLGDTIVNLKKYSPIINEHRFYFHCPLYRKPADEWEHYEYHATGKNVPILFSFFWIPLHQAESLLIAEQGELLQAITF